MCQISHPAAVSPDECGKRCPIAPACVRCVPAFAPSVPSEELREILVKLPLPLLSRGLIPRNSEPLSVGLCKVARRVRLPVACCLPEPSRGLRVILPDPVAVAVHESECVLPAGIALLRGLQVPMWKRGGCQLCFWKNSVGVSDRIYVLSLELSACFADIFLLKNEGRMTFWKQRLP